MVNKKDANDIKKRVTYTLDPTIIKRLKDLAEETLIPQSRLVEKALTQLLDDYQKQKHPK